MRKFEIYTGEKTYMFLTGKLANVQTVVSEYPAILVFPHVVETDENSQVLFAIHNLSALCSMYGIEQSLTDNEKIAMITDIFNTVQDESISAEERIADALELQVMMSLPDVEVV